ncbi:MAG: V-type ATP synthase subunit F [Nitrososphaerales archaeon]|nr:V-type ATP synthase subunit F [Nitrososphaerales archaeon]
MSVVAIGDPTFIAGFKMIGAEGLKATDANEVLKILSEVLKTNKYAMIILPDRYVEITAEIRSRIIKEGKVTPIFSFIPDYTGIKGKRIEELKRSVSLAVGAKLKL